MIPAESQRLWIYADAHDRAGGRPLYEAIVARARAIDIAGASVFAVEMSYGSHRRLHDAASDYGFIGLPVVIEIVDAPERIAFLLADLGPLLAGVVAIVRPVRVVRYAHTDSEAYP